MTNQTSMVSMLNASDPAAPVCGYGVVRSPCEPAPSADSRIAEVLDFLMAHGAVSPAAVAVARAAIDSWHVVQEALAKAAAESKTLQ